MEATNWRTEFAAVAEGLWEPVPGVWFAPVRHHSPACAFAVRALIEAVRPKQVLIEAGRELSHLIPLIADPATIPPVAAVTLFRPTVGDTEAPRVASYSPFCSHSPEYVAIKSGLAAGATVQFIDLPAAEIHRLGADVGEEVDVVPVSREGFTSGSFIRALAHATGCRDGYEMWDHLFEARLGQEDWRSLLSDVGAYCAAIRAATPQELIDQTGDTAREAHMAGAVARAVEAGGPIVVVTGGFHTPALIAAVRAGGKPPRAPARSGDDPAWLIRYDFISLDALVGYGAGLPQPWYYDWLWSRAQDVEPDAVWRETALDLTGQFAAWCRTRGHPLSVPQQIEMVRVAETLALMRGRPGCMRHDLLDAARTALVKGEASLSDPWSERLISFLRGTAIGDIPASAGSPPIVEDARARARKHRFDLSTSQRKRTRLDIRRNPNHLATSRFLHAMTLLETGFGQRETGPDFLNAVAEEQLIEEWLCAWSPVVEGRLIDKAAHADTVDAACLHVLEQAVEALTKAGKADDIVTVTGYLVRGLLAGLGEQLGPMVAKLQATLAAHGSFTLVAQTLRKLHHLSRARGPLEVPQSLDLSGLARTAYVRLIYLCDELPDTPDVEVTERIEALRLMGELLAGDSDGQFDRSLFDDAMDRVAQANPPHAILGSVLALCVQAGRREPADLTRALEGNLGGAVTDEADRAGVLSGLLSTVPQLLWLEEGLLKAADRFMSQAEELTFLALLPHLRLAFTQLSPREIDRLAEGLALLHRGSASAFMPVHHDLTEADFQLGLALETSVRAGIQNDGLKELLELDAGA